MHMIVSLVSFIYDLPVVDVGDGVVVVCPMRLDRVLTADDVLPDVLAILLCCAVVPGVILVPTTHFVTKFKFAVKIASLLTI